MKLPQCRFRRKIKKRFRIDNKGSAIVTTIVVTLFISIIATTMLFVSGRNFIMKQTDYQNKQSFYKAEETLDKLKELLVAEVDEAYAVAYKDMMREYARLKTDDAQMRRYADTFTTYLEDKKWKPRVGLNETDRMEDSTPEMRLAAVRRFMEDRGVDPDMTKLITEVGGFRIMSIDNKNRFVIQGVQVYYVDDKGFSAYIKTDIALTPPEYKASGSTSAEPEKMNMTENVIYINWQKN